MHVRQRIREAAAAALTGLPTTGARVFTGDPYPKDQGDGPVLVVAAPEEVREDDLSDIGRITGRRLTLIVIGTAEAIDIEGLLDGIAADVEAAIEGQTFGGLAKTTIFMRASKDIFEGTRKRSGEVRIEFAIFYRTPRGNPTEAAS